MIYSHSGIISVLVDKLPKPAHLIPNYDLYRSNPFLWTIFQKLSWTVKSSAWPESSAPSAPANSSKTLVWPEICWPRTFVIRITPVRRCVFSPDLWRTKWSRRGCCKTFKETCFRSSCRCDRITTFSLFRICQKRCYLGQLAFQKSVFWC